MSDGSIYNILLIVWSGVYIACAMSRLGSVCFNFYPTTPCLKHVLEHG